MLQRLLVDLAELYAKYPRRRDRRLTAASLRRWVADPHEVVRFLRGEIAKLAPRPDLPGLRGVALEEAKRLGWQVGEVNRAATTAAALVLVAGAAFASDLEILSTTTLEDERGQVIVPVRPEQTAASPGRRSSGTAEWSDPLKVPPGGRRAFGWIRRS